MFLNDRYIECNMRERIVTKCQLRSLNFKFLFEPLHEAIVKIFQGFVRIFPISLVSYRHWILGVSL